MPPPNPETRAVDHPLRKRRKRLRNDVIAGLLVILFLAFLIHNNIHSAQVFWNSSMVLQELSLEVGIQERILKSCLPAENKKCKQFIPEGTTAQRVAIVSPPGLLATALERLVDHAAEKSRQGEFEFIRTSHVPPALLEPLISHSVHNFFSFSFLEFTSSIIGRYGYGKTHGLTKIIRLVPQPIMLGVTDMFLNSHDLPAFSQKQVSIGDLKVALRQLMRFHCRLSHVSAHTALFTIPLNDMIQNPDQVVDQLRLFLGGKSDGEEQQVQQQHIRTAMEVHQTRKELKDETTSTLRSVRSSAVALLSHVSSDTTDDLLTVLNSVLNMELQKTNNLTDWPCQSFWSAGEEADPYLLPLESIRIAALLSPNCSAPLSNCWVHRDLCEAKGDGPCKE